MPGLRIGHATFDAHTLLFSSLAILCGYQWILFAIFVRHLPLRRDSSHQTVTWTAFFELMNLEKGLVVAALCDPRGWRSVADCCPAMVADWFRPLDYAYTMRFVVPGATLVALGFQTVFSSFFVSILGMRRK